MSGIPLAHRVAWQLSVGGIRGASRYWPIAERLAPLPTGGLVVLLDGTPLVFDRDDYTAVNLYRGLYERPELAILPSLVRPGDTAIDVGANIGGFAARLAALVGADGRVVALEPSPRCMPALAALVERFPQLDVQQVAAGAGPGEAILRKHDRPGHAGVGTLRSGVEGSGEAVRVVRLDDLGTDGEVGLLKIDVEGFEPEALTGGRAVLGRTRFVLAEVSPEFDTEAWFGDLVDDLVEDHIAFVIGERGRLRARPMLVRVDGDAIRRCSKQFNLLIARRDVVERVQRFVRS